MTTPTTKVATDEGTFEIAYSGTRDILVTGTIHKRPDNGYLTYTAAAPAEVHMSVAGSGLPYMSREQAFHATPNTGLAKVDKRGNVEIRLELPGSYYVGLGTILVPPTLFLTYARKGSVVATHVPLAPPIAYRFCTYPMQFVKPRTGPMFYEVRDEPLPRTQEQILRDSQYPVDGLMAPDFWGKRPPR